MDLSRRHSLCSCMLINEWLLGCSLFVHAMMVFGLSSCMLRTLYVGYQTPKSGLGRELLPSHIFHAPQQINLNVLVGQFMKQLIEACGLVQQTEEILFVAHCSKVPSNHTTVAAAATNWSGLFTFLLHNFQSWDMFFRFLFLIFHFLFLSCLKICYFSFLFYFYILIAQNHSL